MKKLQIVVLLLLIPVLFYLNANDQPASKKKIPKLLIKNSTYDAGKILRGEELKHTFTVKNKGTADLRIKKVDPG